jgi:hypothetical protein
MREIVHMQAGQCGNQIGAKVNDNRSVHFFLQFSCSCSSSGKSFPMNMVLIPQATIMAIQTFNLNASTFTSMKLEVEIRAP